MGFKQREYRSLTHSVADTGSSERQYKRRIIKWHLNKNVKSYEKDAIIVRERLGRKLDDDIERDFSIDGRIVPGRKIRRYMRINPFGQIKRSTPTHQEAPDVTPWNTIGQGFLDNVQSNNIRQDTLGNFEVPLNTLCYVSCSAPFKPALSRKVDLYNFISVMTELVYSNMSGPEQRAASHEEQQEAWMLKRMYEILRENHHESTRGGPGPCVFGDKCSIHICHVILRFQEMSGEELHDQLKKTLDLRRLGPWERHGFYRFYQLVYDLGLCSLDCAATGLPITSTLGQDSPIILVVEGALPISIELLQVFISSHNSKRVINYVGGYLEFTIQLADMLWDK